MTDDSQEIPKVLKKQLDGRFLLQQYHEVQIFISVFICVRSEKQS